VPPFKHLTNKLKCTTIVDTIINKGIGMKQAINIRLEKDIVQTLDDYAHELGKTRTNLVEKAIELYFDKLEEMIADKRIDNLKSGKSTIVTLEEVFKKAGIDA
jgi:predicted DNA-binding protein